MSKQPPKYNKIRVIVEPLNKKYEWRLIGGNNRTIAVSEKIYTERSGAAKGAQDFCDLVNATVDLKVGVS